MSSEMRKVLEASLSLAKSHLGFLTIYDYTDGVQETRELIRDLEALLARTEAGAGGGAPICLFDATNPCDGTCGECHHLHASPKDAAPVADGAVDLYGPLTGAQEASMRGACMTHLRTVEVEYPDTGKFIRDWLTHVESERNRLFDALRAHPQDPSERLIEALAKIRDYEGDPSTPVRNSAKKSGIARAALAALHQPAKGGAL